MDDSIELHPAVIPVVLDIIIIRGGRIEGSVIGCVHGLGELPVMQLQNGGFVAEMS